MRKLVVIIFLVFCAFTSANAKEKDFMSESVSGRDFYFANLAYQDFSSQLWNVFIQDTKRTDEYIEYLKSLKEKYCRALTFEDLILMSPKERHDYQSLRELESSSSEEEYRKTYFANLFEYKFVIRYEEETVNVYFFIDNPSVRGGDAEYVFDYNGSLISKKYGK